MRVVVVVGTVLLLFITSCSYVAGEAASNYAASGGRTFSYVESRPLSSTLAGHGTAIGVGIILNSIAGMWAVQEELKDRRKLAFDCMMSGGSEEDCKIEASHRERIKRIYFLSLNSGQCTKSIWNPFAAFNKCYDEAFSDLESLAYGKSLEEALYQVYHDDKLIDCMPDPLDYKQNTDELKTIYFKCKQEAEEFASKELADIKDKVREYAKKVQESR